MKIYQLKSRTNFLFYYSPWRILISVNSLPYKQARSIIVIQTKLYHHVLTNLIDELRLSTTRRADTGKWLGRKACWLGERESELNSKNGVLSVNSRAEEKDVAITSTQMSWFIGFGNRDYNCMFPNGRNIAVFDWEVVKLSEVLKT